MPWWIFVVVATTMIFLLFYKLFVKIAAIAIIGLIIFIIATLIYYAVTKKNLIKEVIKMFKIWRK